jgi:D-alanyl-lipoteichoic acid acyltransferase DltB (MBOAT superfamily)
MFFNSIDFAIFLPVVFVLYWFVAHRNLKAQNVLVVLASYLFYGWWDYRFLSLILFSTLVDFVISRRLQTSDKEKERKALLITSLVVNLGMLGFFKYYNFFIENFITAFTWFGMPITGRMLNVVLPVGISFYTFQTLSYTIDVYRRKLVATDDFIAFTAFVSFFPQLVAGPIERATNLLPQFYKRRVFEYAAAADGMRQILWGLFKKVVIADGCAEYANLIFDNHGDYSGSTLALGAFFFAFQIYGDFSGYSDIAIGTARLFGFDLMQNFAFPYFSRDIAEFWRRWHISLSTWFRDYLYVPLGGSRGGTWMKVRNTFIIFLVSGFWHGANWTFVAWGALNAIFFMPLLLRNRNRNNLGIVAKGKWLPSLTEGMQILFTFSLTVFAWIFFRAESMSHAWAYVGGILSTSLFSLPRFPGIGTALPTIAILVAFIAAEWLGREGRYALEGIGRQKLLVVRWTVYAMVLLTMFFFGNFETSIEFIYFQF